MDNEDQITLDNAQVKIEQLGIAGLRIKVNDKIKIFCLREVEGRISHSSIDLNVTGDSVRLSIVDLKLICQAMEEAVKFTRVVISKEEFDEWDASN